MKSLFIISLLVSTFSSFAAQNHNVDCNALSESNDRVAKVIKSDDKKKSKQTDAVVKK